MPDLCVQLLDRTADQILNNPIIEPDPMLGDRWLLASVLQKSIRRGETDTAMGAAASLWRQDRTSLFRRLITIAPEDVGVGDMEVVAKTFLALTSAEWRRHVGELQVILYLVTALSNAYKNRLTEEIYTQIEKSPELISAKKLAGASTDAKLVRDVRNGRMDLTKRCLSLWFLLGTRKYPSDTMLSRGPYKAAYDLLRGLPVDPLFTETCIRALPKTQWPLAGFLPVISHKMQTETYETVEASIPDTPRIEAVPLYALDTFTRGGQTAFRQLRSNVKELHEFSVKQIGLAVFYLEGRTLNKYLTSPFLDRMQRKGEYADIYEAGLCDARYMGLKELLNTHWPLLQEIRAGILKRSLVGGGEW